MFTWDLPRPRRAPHKTPKNPKNPYIICIYVVHTYIPLYVFHTIQINNMYISVCIYEYTLQSISQIYIYMIYDLYIYICGCTAMNVHNRPDSIHTWALHVHMLLYTWFIHVLILIMYHYKQFTFDV